MMKRAPVLFALLLAVACGSRDAMTQDPARDIERFVQSAVEEFPDIPGVGIAVVRDGRNVYVAGAGYRDVERRIRSDAKSVYYIGSTTKAYTGLACAILAHRGVLDLDAPIRRYIPEAKSEASLRAFLTHSVPIENDAIVFRTAYSGEHTQAQLISLLNDSKPREPGFRYDNLGYVVASLVLERVTGKPWQDVLDELVFGPLGMEHTSARMSEAEHWPMAVPYRMTREGKSAPLGFMKNDRMMHAAGGIVTTPDDLARWMQANVTNGRIDGEQRIPAAAFAEAHELQVSAASNGRSAFSREGYGFGWFQGTFEGHAILSHGGGYAGWQSAYSFMPDDRIGVGVMANANGTSTFMELLAGYAYERLLNAPDVDARYAKRLAELRKNLTYQKARMIAEYEKIGARPWMLHHPNDAYAGRYANAAYGMLSIEARDGKLWASLGPLSSAVEAYTDDETARVELVPGNGEVLRFSFTGAERADSVKMGNDVFERE